MYDFSDQSVLILSCEQREPIDEEGGEQSTLYVIQIKAQLAVLKVYNRNPEKPEKDHQSFQTEKSALEALRNSPYIVHIEGANEGNINEPQQVLDQINEEVERAGTNSKWQSENELAGGSSWILMEYCDLGTVEELLREYDASDRKLPLAFVLHVLEALTEASGAMRNSESTIFHGDIHIGNILLKTPTSTASHDQYPDIKLADFGIAELIHQPAQNPDIDQGFRSTITSALRTVYGMISPDLEPGFKISKDWFATHYHDEAAAPAFDQIPYPLVDSKTVTMNDLRAAVAQLSDHKPFLIPIDKEDLTEPIGLLSPGQFSALE